MLNWTSNGDDGCDPRLGEELGPLIDGEEGLPVPLVVDMVRFSGAGIIGLDSKDGEGEVTAGDCRAKVPGDIELEPPRVTAPSPACVGHRAGCQALEEPSCRRYRNL